MDREEFFERAMQPLAFGDEMDFSLIRGTNTDLEQSFSVEGFEALAYQMHDWVVARTLSFYRRRRAFPKSMRVRVSIEWDEVADSDENDNPWWSAIDKGTTKIAADGSNRRAGFLDRTGGGDVEQPS